jgi:hypothetical protein
MVVDVLEIHRAGDLHESAMAFAIDNPWMSRVCNIMRCFSPRAQ